MSKVQSNDHLLSSIYTRVFEGKQSYRSREFRRNPREIDSLFSDSVLNLVEEKLREHFPNLNKDNISVRVSRPFDRMPWICEVNISVPIDVMFRLFDEDLCCLESLAEFIFWYDNGYPCLMGVLVNVPETPEWLDLCTVFGDRVEDIAYDVVLRKFSMALDAAAGR